MGWRKRFKKLVNKVPAVKVFKGLTGKDEKSSSSSDDGMRSEAAKRLVEKNVTQQAGGGQINYRTEELI